MEVSWTIRDTASAVAALERSGLEVVRVKVQAPTFESGVSRFDFWGEITA